MKSIIIYGSKYGTGKQYATYLAKQTNIECISYDSISNLQEYDCIIYIGSLYAGGVLGMKKTFEKIKVDHQKIILATVGLADPADQDNIHNIEVNMKKQLAPEVFQKALIYHLRGGIDYSKLDFKHKTMMALLYNKAKKLPEEKQTADAKALVATYNSVVNFVDYASLDPIIKEIEEYNL